MDPALSQLKEKAAAARAKGQHKKALEAYQALVKAEPDNLMHALRVGDSLASLGRLPEALDTYEAIADRYAADGQLVRAVSVLKMVLKLSPDRTASSERLAALYSVRGLATVAHEAVVDVQVAKVEQGNPAATVPLLDLALPDIILPSEVRGHAHVENALAGARQELAKQLGKTTEAIERLVPKSYRPRHIPPTPLFSQLEPRAFERLIACLEGRTFEPGSVLCREGDTTRSLYIIAEGRAHITTQDQNGRKLLLGELKPGDFFGEAALLSNRPRNATVTTLESIDVLELTATAFESVSREFPEILAVMEVFHRSRVADNALAKHPLFSALTAKERWSLIAGMTLETYSEGEAIIREGDAADAMFLVKEGRLRVETRQGEATLTLADLGPGDVFGEMALVSDTPRTATVTPKERTRVFQLSRSAAVRVMVANVNLGKRLASLAHERDQNTIGQLMQHVGLGDVGGAVE